MLSRFFSNVFGCLLIFAGIVPSIALAQTGLSDGADFFEKEVRPLLVARCHQCHGDFVKPKGKLRLTSRANILQGGESGPVVVPGKPTESLLIQAIGYTDALKMPPKEKLPDGEVAILTRWVKMGLPWPQSKIETAKNSSGSEEYQISSEQRAFWSFQPVKDHVPPGVKDESWVKTGVDRFILAALEKKELRPAPAADKCTLIRRATFDLIGLPPTP